MHDSNPTDRGAQSTTKGIHGQGLMRRDFLKFCAGSFCGLCLAHLVGAPGTLQAQMAQKGLIRTKLSPYYTPRGGEGVQCELCPRHCLVPKGERGYCRVRENREGRLYSLVYGNPCVLEPYPIEREPFFHVLPGTRTLSVSTAGCSFQCMFCENWEISQAFPEEVYSYRMPPVVVVKRPKKPGPVQ